MEWGRVWVFIYPLMLFACTYTFADSPARLSQCCCVCPWHKWMREGCGAKASFPFVQINIYSFVSLHAHPQQLAFVIIQITTFLVPASSYPLFLFLLTSFQVNRKDPISWSNWIHYHLITQSNGSHIAISMSLILKMKGNWRMGGWHRWAAKRALTLEVTQGLLLPWKIQKWESEMTFNELWVL